MGIQVLTESDASTKMVTIIQTRPLIGVSLKEPMLIQKIQLGGSRKQMRILKALVP
jgi:hypothetical protein